MIAHQEAVAWLSGSIGFDVIYKFSLIERFKNM